MENITQQQIMELRARMSQEEIAAAVGANQGTISRWEHGEVPRSVEVAAAIAELLKTTRRKWRKKGS